MNELVPESDVVLTVKSCASSSCMHVQEHLTVLRTMVVTFPARFPELAALADVEEEIDFFNNIAHIQMHRRSRALARLSRVRDQIPLEGSSHLVSPRPAGICVCLSPDEEECADRRDRSSVAGDVPYPRIV